NAAIFISHKLDEVVEICDRMSVMRDGRMIGTVAREETNQRQLANMMVGREVLLRVHKEAASPGEVALAVEGLTLPHPFKPRNVLVGVSFEVRKGEVLGVAGIEGNGQSELVVGITGLRTDSRGTVRMLAGGKMHG